MDVLGDASPDVYARTIATVMADDGVDMVVAVYAPTLVSNPDDVAAAIAGSGGSKPLVAVLVGRGRGLVASDDPTIDRVPVFGSVEPAIAALKSATAYAMWRRQPHPAPVAPPGIDRVAARAVIDRVLDADPPGRWLDADEVNALLDAYGIQRLPTAVVPTRTAAREAAQRFGFPVALKAVGPDIVHKTELGGVNLNIDTAAALDRAWKVMQQQVGSAMEGAIVQPMAEPGVETIAGVVRDPTFGPLVVFGVGGTIAELIGDRCVRVAPLSMADGSAMMHGLRCSPLLTGYRGSTPTNLVALQDLLVRLGAIAADLLEVAELDLNPVIATPSGAVAVDARIRLQPAQRGSPAFTTARHLAPPLG